MNKKIYIRSTDWVVEAVGGGYGVAFPLPLPLPLPHPIKLPSCNGVQGDRMSGNFGVS